MSRCGLVVGMTLVLLIGRGAWCAEDEVSKEKVQPDAAAQPESPLDQAKDTVGEVQQKVENLADDATKKVDEISREVNRSPQARQISAGILQPIYDLAEQLAFPMFHWAAFAVMATGVVSYTLQLVIGKLVVLTKSGFSPAEILSDALGLAISLVGLVLTTQAAAENSDFTRSPFAVLSAAGTGLVCGFIFYRWGQSQEVQATMARRLSRPPKP